MHAVTKAMLERSISVLQAHQPWADYSIGWAYGQPRLEAKNGSVDISPRGTKRQVNEYIWMMIRALQMAESHVKDLNYPLQMAESHERAAITRKVDQ